MRRTRVRNALACSYGEDHTMERRLIKVEQVAATLGLHPATTRRLAARGVIPGRRIGGRWYFDPEMLREHVFPRAPGDCNESERTGPQTAQG